MSELLIYIMKTFQSQVSWLHTVYNLLDTISTAKLWKRSWAESNGKADRA